MGGRLIGNMLLWGLVFIAFGSLSLYTAVWFYPKSLPFLILVILGNAIYFTRVDHSEENPVDIEELVELIRTMTPWERRVFLGTITVIALGMIAFQVSIIGSLSTYLAYEHSLPIVGMLIAVLYPPIDAWLGRNYSSSIGSLGFWTAIIVMEGVARLVNISPEIPKQAGSSFRGILA